MQNIAKNMRSGSGVMENRGRDGRSKKNVEKKHKSRRIYLSLEFNIVRLSKAYNSSVAPNYQVIISSSIAYSIMTST